MATQNASIAWTESIDVWAVTGSPSPLITFTLTEPVDQWAVSARPTMTAAVAVTESIDIWAASASSTWTMLAVSVTTWTNL